ncbi:hypothetical protein CJ195_13065 [Bacillus sp. UMB0899]|nr:hypothetical protein CJ195_13065 [Bacillus sp. UMB0899]
MSLIMYAAGCILLTVVIFFLMKKLYQRFPYPIFVPIFTTSLLIVCILLLFNISYQTYMSGGEWIAKLLGPAVVALAIPLFDHREMLKKYFLTIVFSVSIGAIVGISSGLLLGVIFQLDQKLLLSIAPKSVTTPIAMDISELSGGTPTLTAVYVMAAGIFGAMFGQYVMNLFKVKHPISKGIGFGTSSHGIGTARALEIGSIEGAISSISMTLSAILTSIFCPIIISFIL